MSGRVTVRIAALAITLGAVLAAVVAAPALGRSMPCPDPHDVTVRDLLALSPMDVGNDWGENPRAHACFGGETITIGGYANWPDGLGGTSVSGVKPAYFEWPRFYLFASSREVAPGYGRGPFYGIVVPPRLGAVENRYHRAWVVVTARFADPLANQCRGYGPKADRLRRAEAIASCRDRLVMVSIARAPGAPATDAAAAGDASSSPWAEEPGLPPPAMPLLALVGVAGAVAGWRGTARMSSSQNDARRRRRRDPSARA